MKNASKVKSGWDVGDDYQVPGVSGMVVFEGQRSDIS